MGDNSGDIGRDSGEAPQVEWFSLESELSAGALESLREHLQVKRNKSLRCYCHILCTLLVHVVVHATTSCRPVV